MLVHVVLELNGEVGEHHVRQKPVRDFGHECGLPVFLQSPESSIDEGSDTFRVLHLVLGLLEQLCVNSQPTDLLICCHCGGPQFEVGIDDSVSMCVDCVGSMIMPGGTGSLP